ncbi:MAG: hypothetical protein K2F83_00100 [Oscillospiraceae bacterium]|nr:hypothetical protein [Oscillospiraceae bacterium]
MMTAYLLTHEGKKLTLPLLTGWRLIRTGTVPCDSFEGTCLWEGGTDGRLEECCRLVVEEDGQRRFTGVLDECELTWSEKGSTLTVSGRGLAALLLDNESPGKDYQAATLADILQEHVTPYGIRVSKAARLPTVPNFSTATGSSQWQVLYSFAKYHGGVEPRFDVYGALTVDGKEGGRTLKLTDSHGPLELTWRDKRYGVYSEILVRDRGSLREQRVSNKEFTAQGGSCQRVMTMPGKSAYEAMRYSGEYQLKESYAKRFRLHVTLPGSYVCEPGDRIKADLKRPGIQGLWRVLETESVLDAQGRRVKLTLGEG